MNMLHRCMTSKWFNIDNKIVDHRP
ncbi:tryptophanase leader peptide [Salmonella enterica]|nr:tryptophanase leader peptide [Salmonella enterica]EGA9923878.1 tryptophanase leader peptide [Salmonella enterica subsp. enterica serovar Saintpaul]ELW3003179.1 tryptophanase leader peptide [Salmonella enterica]